jgi:hypothetical protein
MAGEKQDSDVLGMSDEDFLNANPADYEMSVQADEDEDLNGDAKDGDQGTEEEQDQKAESEDGADEADEGDKPKSDGSDESDEDKEEDAADTPEGDLDAPEKDAEPEKAEPKKAAEPAAVDYEASYKKLMAPFKANGREIEPNSVDDAISLMQMGANYNKRMAALKPNMKFLKMLENNDLLDEQKLSFLIELANKDHGAINKLVKDSGLDPLDLDAEKASEYRPKTHSIDDREIELDSVLDEIQTSSAYSKTINVVSKEWDGSSKQIIAQHPQLLKVINSHVESGIYDLISAEVERERVFGRLDGLSDLDAYRQVGDALQARGGFNHLQVQQKATPPAAPKVIKPKPKQADSDKLKDKKRAASVSQSGGMHKSDADFNPLALSDEEFMKYSESKYR